MSKGNSTISLTYKFKGDMGGLKEMVRDVERMQQAFRDGVQPAEQLRTSLVNFNQIAQSFDTIGQSVSGLNDIVQDLANAYAVQQQAEVKLETVMRQRMEATDEEIQQIKDLCSAQQELGVVGDEVQLAGVQQMATFLENKDALAALVPAMNNLVVQQKGLAATQQDCQNIGNMFGKVMQGQVSALRRVGISFTEAQEAALKNGNEMERAALLAQIITDNVGDMNAEMAKTDAGRAQQLANSLGDVREQIGAIVAGMAPYSAFASQLVSTAANASRAGAAMRGLYTATLGANGAFKFINASAIASATGMNAAGTAARFLAAGLRMIMAATAITLVLSAISAAVEYFTGKAKEAKDATDNLSDSASRLKMAEEQVAQTMRDTRAQLEQDIATTRNFNGTRQQEQKIVAELNQRYGETMGYFSSVSGWYKTLVSNSKVYCDQMLSEARTRMYANRIAQLEQQNHDLVYNADGSKKKYDNTKVVHYDREVRQGPGGTRNVLVANGYEKTDLDRAVDQIGANNAAIKHLRGQMNAAANATLPTMPVRGSATLPSASATHAGGSRSSAATQREKTLLDEIEDQIRANQNAALTADAAELVSLQEKTRALVVERDRLREVQESLVSTPEQAYTPPQIEEIKTYDQLNAAINYHTTRLNAAEADARVEISATINRLEELRDLWDSALDKTPAGPDELDKRISDLVDSAKVKFASLGSPLAGMDAGSLLSSYRQIQSILSGADGDITAEQRKSLQLAADEYARYAARAVASVSTVRNAWGNIKGIVGGVNSMKQAIEGSGNAWEKMSAIVDGTFQIFDGLAGIVQLVKTMTEVTQGLSGATRTLTTVTEGMAAAKEVETAATEARAIAETTAAASSVAASTEKTNANMLEAGSGFMAANSKLPIVGIAVAAAAIASMIAMMASLPKFAQGGIAYGPTVGLFGEYAGASNNPEVVAPLDRLRSLIGEPEEGGGRLVARVTGEQLDFILERRRRRKNRM